MQKFATRRESAAKEFCNVFASPSTEPFGQTSCHGFRAKMSFWGTPFGPSSSLDSTTNIIDRRRPPASADPTSGGSRRVVLLKRPNLPRGCHPLITSTPPGAPDAWGDDLPSSSEVVPEPTPPPPATASSLPATDTDQIAPTPSVMELLSPSDADLLWASLQVGLPTGPKKTLEERELEYEEARRRIFGQEQLLAAAGDEVDDMSSSTAPVLYAPGAYVSENRSGRKVRKALFEDPRQDPDYQRMPPLRPLSEHLMTCGSVSAYPGGWNHQMPFNIPQSATAFLQVGPGQVPPHGVQQMPNPWYGIQPYQGGYASMPPPHLQTPWPTHGLMSPMGGDQTSFVTMHQDYVAIGSNVPMRQINPSQTSAHTKRSPPPADDLDHFPCLPSNSTQTQSTY